MRSEGTAGRQPMSRSVPAVAAIAAALVVAGCSSSIHKAVNQATPSGAAGQAPGPAVTIDAVSVSGYGSVLVDSAGRSLYTLTSEQGAKNFTCTTSNSCTHFWPPLEVTSGSPGPRAGTGVTAGLLGTAPSPDGTIVTYGGWPLYTYYADANREQTNGQGLTEFGGTWYLLSPMGHTVTAKGAAPTPTTGRSGGSYSY